jgi:hypothetical protein
MDDTTASSSLSQPQPAAALLPNHRFATTLATMSRNLALNTAPAGSGGDKSIARNAEPQWAFR